MFGFNSGYVEDLYAQYRQDPASVSESWREFFADFDPGPSYSASLGAEASETDGKVRMGGYVIEWNARAAQFVDVRGSGHLVPLNRPHSSYALIDAFTSGIPLPELNPTGQGGGR